MVSMAWCGKEPIWVAILFLFCTKFLVRFSQPPVVNLIAKLQTSIEKIYTKKDSNVASSSSSASSEGHLTPDTAQYDMSLQAMNQNEAPSPLTSKAPGLAKQAPGKLPLSMCMSAQWTKVLPCSYLDESMFANWPIEQFVASLSDATIGYDKMLSDNDIIQKCTIPFWGAPSGYDWQGEQFQMKQYKCKV